MRRRRHAAVADQAQLGLTQGLRAIDPAVAEVNALSDYMVEILPIKTGRAVTHVEMRWWRKDGDAGGAADRALQFSKIGRRARAEGRVEQVTPVPVPRPRPAWLEGRGAALQTATYETARLRHPGYDIYFVESEWRNWTAGKDETLINADARRLIDFASGLSLGLYGRIERVTSKVFLLSPENVAISGDGSVAQADPEAAPFSQ